MDLIEKLIGGLFLVIPVIWLVVYAYSKYGAGAKAQKGLMRVVTNLPLGPKKSISVVNIAGEYLVLGVSAEQINFLTRINDRSISDRLENPGNSGGSASRIGQAGPAGEMIAKLFGARKLNMFNYALGKGKAALGKNG